MQGKTINDYTLQHLIGRGGMAEVWYAENSIEKAAAVKILREDFAHNPDIVERFRNEAKVMVKLNHPNIRQVYGYGDVDGRPAIIMEYLDGDDLKAKMKKGERFGEQQLEKWWNQMTDALNYTHGKGVVHRDIKPSNIFIDTNGNVRLLDFGIAKIKESISSTQTGSMLGTLMYMSPEQVKDPKRVDYRSDVYSLAVTFVHLLTGKAPYDSTSSSDFEIQLSIVQQPLDLSALPAAWRSFLKPYLAKDSDDRPALKHFGASAQQATPDDATVHDTFQSRRTENTNDGTVADSRTHFEPKHYSIVAKDKDDLQRIIKERMEKFGPNCDLNDIDVSNVTDMSWMFSYSQFNGDISKWNVSKVTDMSFMFSDSPFNGDISKWDVSNVTDMNSMFEDSQFNGDISKWNVSKVTDMNSMFEDSPFNGDISKWDVSNVTDMHDMFSNSQFNGDISKWNVSKVKDMGCMFVDSPFNGDISKWDVSNVTDMHDMFFLSQFNGDISKWDVSNVTNMYAMFRDSKFNGDISKWNVSNVMDMGGMFSHSPFNGDISKWDVSNVTNMRFMFSYSQFTGDISKWDVANVTDMSQMFEYSPFNGDISKWNVANVTDMHGMFSHSPFNDDISKWNVANVTNMGDMFSDSPFNGDISKWDVANVTDMRRMFRGSPLESRKPQWYKWYKGLFG